MEFIRKLPFIIGALTAVVIGIISFKYGAPKQTIYIRMAVGMLVFYIIGVYARSTLNKIVEEVNRKKESDELKRQAEMQEGELDVSGPEQAAKVSSGKIDYRVDDAVENSGEEFMPLTVERVTVKNEN